MKMTDLVRRALVGDRVAQEECTRQGIALPCPFCGGILTLHGTRGLENQVVCAACNASTGWRIGEQAALTAWNTRRAMAIVRCGRWNDINPAVLNPGIAWVCRCSLCGCPQDHKHNYCPNCGARMEGRNDS